MEWRYPNDLNRKAAEEPELDFAHVGLVANRTDRKLTSILLGGADIPKDRMAGTYM